MIGEKSFFSCLIVFLIQSTPVIAETLGTASYSFLHRKNDIVRDKGRLFQSNVYNKISDGALAAVRISRVSVMAGLQVTSRRPLGGHEQKQFSPLGNELHFDANLAEKFL